MAEDIRWITINGTHIPIKDGQTPEEALKERQISHSKKEAEQRNSEKQPPKLKDAKTFEEFKKTNFSEIKRMLHEDDVDFEDIKEAWYGLRHETLSKNPREMSYDEIQNAGSDFRQSAYTGWFRDANSDYKPELAHTLFSSDKEFNIGMSIAYFHYRIQHDDYSFLNDRWRSDNAMSFKKWLDTPMTLYRGHRGQQSVQSDVFIAYTPDKKVAQKFGKNLETIQITPRETWGAYNLTGEAEYWIPAKWLRENKK